jgi:hypothetical protein
VYQNQIQDNDAYVAARGVFARADLFPRVSSVHSLVGLWVVVMLSWYSYYHMYLDR